MIDSYLDLAGGIEGHWLYALWMFLAFDFTRYVLTDMILVTYHLLWWRRSPRLARAKARMWREYPLVSVIVPGHNEGQHYFRLLQSLKAQSYRNLEVIIVDDGSLDDTPTVGRSLCRQGLIDVFIRCEQRGGKASAANLALRCCRGKYVVHLDADLHLHPKAIENLIWPFYLGKIGAVGGDVRVRNVWDSVATLFQTLEYMKTISTGRLANSHLGILRIVSGACGAFPREVLQRLGGWDVGPGLDGDLVLRIRKLGLRIFHQADAVCYTHVPTSWRGLFRQRFRWDRSLIRFRMRKHVDLLLPWMAHFRWSNFFAVADNVVFNLALDVNWFIYLNLTLLFHPQTLTVILPMVLALYGAANVIEAVFALLLYWESGTLRKSELPLLLISPLMPFYQGYYMRTVRTYAYVMEILFRASYFDRWNPWKVSRVSRRLEAEI
ncbi:MAG TPA: glycosyltransferase family 2 protein [Methylothermaceae bacterium]|nr:glycosyltransferase family 2 protein [Methylothermaceae bacterium]